MRYNVLCECAHKMCTAHYCTSSCGKTIIDVHPGIVSDLDPNKSPTPGDYELKMR